METFVTVSVQSEMAAIRREAIVALCCLCLRSLDSARQHMLLLLQAAHIDVHEVRLAAISAVVDLLMRHGLPGFITAGPAEELEHSGSGSEATASRGPASQYDSLSTAESFADSDSAKGATLTQNELNSQGGNSVVAILTKILDEPDLELRTETAEGLCKLLMIGAISSPKLLSRLLLIWYNPMTEPSCKLRHILGTFFPLYCSMSLASQLAMEGAFIPTMRVLFDAPITSPLNEIDVEDVGMFFVHLTKEDMLQSHDASKRPVDVLAASTTSVHDSLAKIVSNEILQDPDAYQAKVLIKVLTNLQLTSNNFVHLRELRVLSGQLLVTVKERLAVRQLEKFDKLLADWLAKDPNARPRSPSVNKRRSSAAAPEEESQADLTAGQSPGRKKRVLFSQSQGTLLDPTSPTEPTRQLDGGSEEELEEVAAQERSTIPSPVAAMEGPPEHRARQSHGGDASASFSAVMSSTRLSRGSEEEEEAEVTVVAESGEEHSAVEEVEEEVEVTTGRGRRTVPAVRVGGPCQDPSHASVAGYREVAVRGGANCGEQGNQTIGGSVLLWF
jgi:condensin complex subunit 3